MKLIKKVLVFTLATAMCQVPVCAGQTIGQTTETPTAEPVTDDYTVFTYGTDMIQVSEGDYTGYEISGTSLTITAAGKYCLQGTCTDGSVTVKKATTGVELVLSNLNLVSESTAPLTFNKSTEVTLDVRGVNVIADTSYNNDEVYTDNSVAENAALKAKEGGSLDIKGNGVLSVYGNGKNGIKSNAELTIAGPTLNIESVDDGISNESSMTIDSGRVNITAGGDGIKSSADDEAVGTVTVNGGTVVIDSVGDGIQATQLVDIKDGTFDITTYDGAESVYDGDDDSYPSAKGIKAGGSYEVTDESGNVTEVDATDSYLTITGGKFTLNCADDAIHSSKDSSITGGDFTIETGDDGIHADYINTIGTQGGSEGDLTVLINQSCEAIEGATVNLHSGTITAYADDDGVNAANSDLSNYTYSINITGGKNYISCNAGDGLDSNKNLIITGGTTVACGNAGLGEGNPLDCDGTMSITNATVLAIGTGNMANTPTTGLYVVYGSSSFGRTPTFGNIGTSSVAVTDGNTVAICDSNSNSLFSATAKWNKTSSNCKASYILFASPDLTKGSTYNLNVNGSNVISATALGQLTVDTAIIGDVDSDGGVTLSDAQTVLKAALNIISLSDTQIAVADMDDDGSISLQDAQTVLKKALNIID